MNHSSSFVRWILAALMLAVVLIQGPALAATRTVCPSGCDFTGIEAAILDAGTLAGDTISIGAGTFTEQDIDVTKSVTITGAGRTATIVQANAVYNTATLAVFSVPFGVTATIKDMTVRHGVGGGSTGGGIDNLGILTVDNLLVERNLGSTGGGIANRSTAGGITLTVTNSVIRQNVSSSQGGGIWATGPTTPGIKTVIQDTSIIGNFTSNNGGGGLQVFGGDVQISRSTISGNRSIGSGGGIWATAATSSIYIDNSTISNNTTGTETSSGVGGAIASSAYVRLDHCTITGNWAPSGGGLSVSETRADLRNTILAGNTGFDGANDCLGQVNSHGYVLIGDLTQCAFAQQVGGDIVGVDPGLDILRDNGGSTLTHALLDQSFAIDAGDCTDQSGNTVTVDQRGVARPQGGGCDIGAFEYDGSGGPPSSFFCWDIDENDSCDLGTEDQNGDGNCTPSDCQGEDGINCWDLDGDRSCDLGSEDLSNDGSCNLIDCRGSIGPQGPACWDTNTNNACDTLEDIDDSSTCNVLDCRGPSGYDCWDTNEDYLCDLQNEDRNGDTDCTPADCQGEDGTDGTNGSNGAPGVACWDSNGNGACNLPGEDPSGDSACTVLDCRGTQGTNGFSCWDLNANHICDAPENTDGVAGCSVGDCQGQDGHACWDLDEDYVCDTAENVNGDLDCTPADCQGEDGPQGPSGVACWDLNANSACNLPTEDPSGDNQCTVLDCGGADGTAGYSCWDLNQNHICDGPEDVGGGGCSVSDCRGADGADGANGFTCWDLDQDYVCDTGENVNGDGVCTVADCLGPEGPEGPMGVACWDLNANGSCQTASEDLDGDDDCTIDDCGGNDGADGFSCWDLNENSICDQSEDENADQLCNLLDCRGQDGADGANGSDGTDGADGNSCWDLDVDGACDPDEDVNGDDECTILDCAGIDGTGVLTNVSDEPAGSNCEQGGVRIDVGIDDDQDGALSEEEIDATQYACDGADGEDGTTATVEVTNGGGGGCGCRVAAPSGAPHALWLLVALLAWRRRACK